MIETDQVADDAAMVETARFLGRLLLHEVNEELRGAMVQPDLASALAEMGIDVSDLPSTDELAAEFMETFIHPPEGGPPVQSLWQYGTYEGDCAVTIRKLAEVAGVEFDRAMARGAPNDHLGCILLLWASVRSHAPEVAERLEEEHMAWALGPLGKIAERESFYGAVSRATGSFIRELSERDPDGVSHPRA